MAHVDTLFLRLTTCNLRHCENEAVFIPSPNRPRSLSARITSGDVLPKRIAALSSDSDIPRPSSITATVGFPRFQSAMTSIRCAPAVIELSTRSATAAPNE